LCWKFGPDVVRVGIVHGSILAECEIHARRRSPTQSFFRSYNLCNDTTNHLKRGEFPSPNFSTDAIPPPGAP
jgi:hypothetical protein